MTYNMFGGTLSLTQSIYVLLLFVICCQSGLSSQSAIIFLVPAECCLAFWPFSTFIDLFMLDLYAANFQKVPTLKPIYFKGCVTGGHTND